MLNSIIVILDQKEVNMSSEINGIGEQVAAKYSKPAIKEATSKKLYQYIGERTKEIGGRFTADDAINELLDIAQRERARKK